MRALTYILILLSAMVMGSCKHEVIPAPASNSPIFGVEGTFGENTFALIAGMDNITMKPSVIEKDGIKIYSGILGDDNSYFQLEIYNGNIDYPNQPKIDFKSVDGISFVPYDQGVLWSMKVSDLPTSGLDAVTWYVNGVEQLGVEDLEISKPGKYEVCLKVKFENQEERILCREVIVGFRKNADFDMTYEIISGSKLKAKASSLLGTITTVNWYLNENLIYTGIQLDTLLSNGKYMLRSEVSFTNGIVLNRSAYVDVSWMGNHIPDFTAYANSTMITQDPNNTWDNKARITYFKDGKTYTSENYNNADRMIAIDKIEYHGKDVNGNPVYILKGDFDVILQDSSSQNYPMKAKIGIGFSVK